jgi:hypothetical protein
MEIFQENKRLFATIIVAIAIVTMTISSMLAATASAISDTGKEHAQRPGSGVCNADDKIHHNAPPQADQGFHGGVEKNFGGPFEGFVGHTTPCQNELP